MLQRQRRRSNRSMAQLAVLATIALAACDNPTPTPSTPEVEPSAVVFPTAAATILPEEARETASMRLFGSDDALVAYEVATVTVRLGSTASSSSARLRPRLPASR
jgi:hypothetical protein